MPHKSKQVRRAAAAATTFTLLCRSAPSPRSIYEYEGVVGAPPGSRPVPVLELVTRSKLSCLAWNRAALNHIASSDYEGERGRGPWAGLGGWEGRAGGWRLGSCFSGGEDVSQQAAGCSESRWPAAACRRNWLIGAD